MVRIDPLRSVWVLLVLATTLLSAPAAAGDFHIALDPPGPREFILDNANKLDSPTKEKRRSLAADGRALRGGLSHMRRSARRRYV
jgi:hypothetical protein